MQSSRDPPTGSLGAFYYAVLFMASYEIVNIDIFIVSQKVPESVTPAPACIGQGGGSP